MHPVWERLQDPAGDVPGPPAAPHPPGTSLLSVATAVTAGRLVLGGQAAFVAWLQRMRHCLERAVCRPRHGTCWACAANNALDGSIMEWGGQPGAAGITVNLAWLAAAAGRAGRAEEALSGESPGIRPGSLADTIGVALQTWPASLRECGRGPSPAARLPKTTSGPQGKHSRRAAQAQLGNAVPSVAGHSSSLGASWFE